VPARNPRTVLPGSTVPVGSSGVGSLESSLEDLDDDDTQPAFL